MENKEPTRLSPINALITLVAAGTAVFSSMIAGMVIADHYGIEAACLFVLANFTGHALYNMGLLGHAVVKDKNDS